MPKRVQRLWKACEQMCGIVMDRTNELFTPFSPAVHNPEKQYGVSHNPHTGGQHFFHGFTRNIHTRINQLSNVFPQLPQGLLLLPLVTLINSYNNNNQATMDKKFRIMLSKQGGQI